MHQEILDKYPSDGRVNFQLQVQERFIDPVEMKVSLAKRRLYRFSDDLLAHVFIEDTEASYLKTGVLPEDTYKALSAYLAALEAGAEPFLPHARLAQEHGFDLEQGLAARLAFEDAQADYQEPKKVLFIIGSPRSGTSHLFNILAYQPQFGYFTDISHFRWPLYNLHHSNGKRHFSSLPPAFFMLDTKSVKLRRDLILPSECEDIFARSIPVYQAVRTHAYVLTDPVLVDEAMLRHNIAKHAGFFHAPYFVAKSPFNSFRIRELAAMCGNRACFLHIHRNGYAASQSIAENGFKYFTQQDSVDDPSVFWARHIEAVLKYAGEVNMRQIAFEELVQNPSGILADIFSWLDIDEQPIAVAGRYADDPRGKPHKKNGLVETFNALLGYK